MGTWAEKSVFSLRTDVLKTRPATLTLKTQVIGYLEHQTKSFDYTVAVLDALEVEINKKILNFEGNAELSEIVKGLIFAPPICGTDRRSFDGPSRAIARRVPPMRCKPSHHLLMTQD
jgi:hypothetical protein